MSRTVPFAYAGARIQARYGRLVARPTWERLHKLDSLGGFLQGARDTALRPWVAQLDAGADVHQIEAQLRVLFRRHVAELAQWAPPEWRPAVRWVEVLPDLPAIAARLRGADAPWLQADARLARVGTAGRERLPAEWRALQAPAGAPRGLAAGWLEYWRALWPPMPPSDRRALEQLVALVQQAATRAQRDAPNAVVALQPPLRRLIRRHMRAPAGLFAWLVLGWIEFTALRGAVVRRRLGLPLEGAVA